MERVKLSNQLELHLRIGLNRDGLILSETREIIHSANERIYLHGWSVSRDFCLFYLLIFTNCQVLQRSNSFFCFFACLCLFFVCFLLKLRYNPVSLHSNWNISFTSHKLTHAEIFFLVVSYLQLVFVLLNNFSNSLMWNSLIFTWTLRCPWLIQGHSQD